MVSGHDWINKIGDSYEHIPAQCRGCDADRSTAIIQPQHHQPPISITTPEGIAFARLCAIKGAVSLECRGLKHSSGRSMTALAKRVYNVKGTKQQVRDQLQQMIDDILATTPITDLPIGPLS